MRVLLVNPFYPISETPSPPLGLAFLAAALEQAGIEVKILDLVVFPYSRGRLESVLNDFSPDLVGSTAVTMTFNNAIKVIQEVKALNPEILTVMGGPHVTFCAEETLRTFPELDAVVLGEGEATVVDLALTPKKKWAAVQGLVFRDGSEIVRTVPRPPIADLDALPFPARHLLPLGRYRALDMAVSMTTSRGCPFHCIFCVGRKMVGGKVRYRNAGLVADELEYLSALNFPQVNLADDLFTANPRHCLAVCDEILARKIKVKWTSFARVDTVSLKVLSRMKEAGCSAVSFGIETGSPEILKTIKKGITLDQVIKAVRLCNEAGLLPHASFILGLPGETPETLKETVEFGRRLHEMGVSYGFHLLAPFPGTEVREKADSFGLKILTDDWSEYHANKAIVETPTVTRQMLDRIVSDWQKEFEDLLEGIKQARDRGEATEEEAWPLTNLENIVLIYDLMMGRVIEEHGSWTAENPAADAADRLGVLVDRVEAAAGRPRAIIARALEAAFQRGDLICQMNGPRLKWRWVDHLSGSNGRPAVCDAVDMVDGSESAYDR